MNNFSLSAILGFGEGSPISVIAFLFSLFLSAILAFICAKVYATTLPKTTKIRDYHLLMTTVVLISATVSLIMLMVGTNLARAFALVGILHLVRFRNPSKGPGDLIFLLLSIAIGMTCGVQYYTLAIVFTIVISMIILILNFFHMSDRDDIEEKTEQTSIEQDKKDDSTENESAI